MEDLKNLLSNKMTLLIIIVCVMLSFQILNFFKSEAQDQKVSFIKKEIQGLKDDISNIYKSEKILDRKIDTFNIQIKNIHEAVAINNTKIENLKKNEKAQVDNFKSFDARKYEQYFADRYSKKSNRTTIK